MFWDSQEELVEQLAILGNRLCQYAGGDWLSRRCDCKYGASGRGEESGCPEIRQAIAIVMALPPAQFQEMRRHA